MEKYKISHTTLKAHWVDVTDATTDNGGRDWHLREYSCDNCGFYARAYGTNALFFCHGCGARMVKAE
jgi:hypothetical protein